MGNFLIVPREPRDKGVPSRLANSLVSKRWNEDFKMRFWTDSHFGARFRKPDAARVRELVQEGLDLAHRLLSMLAVHPRWQGLASYIDPISNSIYDLEAVKTRPHEELVWYTYRAFQALYELHDAFHAFEVAPTEFVHLALHQTYEPLLQVAFLNLIDRNTSSW